MQQYWWRWLTRLGVPSLSDCARGRIPLASLPGSRGSRFGRDRGKETRRYYSASQEGLAELRRYVERMWDDVLAAYAAGDPNPSKSRVVAPPKRKGVR
jgi:hypothetical protein